MRERPFGSYLLISDNALRIALNGHLAARSENMHNQTEGSCNASDSNNNLGGWRCRHHFKLYCGMAWTWILFVDSNSWYYSFPKVGGGEAWQRHMAAKEHAAYGREIFEEFCLEKVDTLYKKGTTGIALQKRPLCHSDGQGGIFPGASHHSKTTVMNHEKIWQKTPTSHANTATSIYWCI